MDSPIHCQQSTKTFAPQTISRAVSAGLVDEQVMDEVNEEQEQRVKLMKLKLHGYVLSNAFIRSVKPGSSTPEVDQQHPTSPHSQLTVKMSGLSSESEDLSDANDDCKNSDIVKNPLDPVGDDACKEQSDDKMNAQSDHVTGNEVDILDSDEFDTDLEPDEMFGKVSSITDFALGVTCYIRECQKKQLPVQQKVIHALKRRSFSLKHRSLGPAQIRALCLALKENLRVECVNLQGTDIGADGIEAVAQMMLENTCITRMNLSNNNLGIRGAQVLGHVMVVTDHLTHLNLSGNGLGDDAAWYFSSAFESNESITHMDLSYNEFGEQGGVIMAAGLARNTGLTNLNLSWNKLVAKGCVAIFRALMINTTISTLDFSWNGMGYDGAVSLSRCIRQNPGLRDLDVSSNRLNPQCARLIAHGLKFNTTLVKLRIGYNPLSTTGCMDILEAVKATHSNINLLDCSEVSVIGEADLLAATISRRRRFEFIHGGIVPSHDKLGERVGREINPMLRIIEYLRLLGLRPLELMRSFDRTTSFEMPRKEFVEQIKKTGVKLHNFEIEALANSISNMGTNKNIINYRKLCVAVRDVVIEERERKFREQTERSQIRSLHKHILQKAILPESQKTAPRPGSGPEFRDKLTRSQNSLTRSQITSRSTESQPGKITLSMTSPLGSTHSFLPSKPDKRRSVRNKGKTKVLTVLSME